MSAVEKAGMMVNGAGEVLGWIEAGIDVEMQEGDVIISHHKSAEKAGLLEQFNELKTANKPVKAKKEKVEGEEKVARVRVDIPTEGAYTVLKPGYAASHTNPECAAIYTLLTTNTNFADFFANAKSYTHIKRDGSAGGEITPTAVAAYAIRRGVIAIA
jgi:hypothetical protein